MGHGGCGAAAGDGEFAQDVGNVDARRFRGNEQTIGDLTIALSGGDKPKHLEFPIRQAKRCLRQAALFPAPQVDAGLCSQRLDLIAEEARADRMGKIRALPEMARTPGALKTAAPSESERSAMVVRSALLPLVSSGR
nr:MULTISPECIES: hypothetical protein [unclassified Rhizobium]